VPLQNAMFLSGRGAGSLPRVQGCREHMHREHALARRAHLLSVVVHTRVGGHIAGSKIVCLPDPLKVLYGKVMECIYVHASVP